ncbi:MAG: response regulator [Chloroflexaceae bacterium]|nr:response regulator [Chloroflexaceae bacterium]
MDEQRQASDLGANGYLIKPITRQRFYQALFDIFHHGKLGSSRAHKMAALAHAERNAPAPLILLAEDNEDNIEITFDYLDARGYRVLVARNGLEAVTYAAEHQPALILMDIQMPKLDGLEAIRRIRAHPQGHAIPIIAVTALAMKGDRERCLEAGANEYLSKPVRLKALVTMIEQHLQTVEALKR